MKKLINIMFIAILSAISLASCDQGFDNVIETKGSLSFKDFEATVQNGEDVIESRATSVDINTFKVVIVNKSTGAEAGAWTYNALPEIVALPVGSYTVKVFNEELQEAAWDAPYFYGSQDFTIKENDVTLVESIICKLSNLKVSIKYSDKLIAAIGEGNDVVVNVTVGENCSLDFKYGETRSGYFRCDTENKSLVATFTGTVDGYYVSEYKVLSDAVAGQHRIITFSLTTAPDIIDENGTIEINGLTFSAEVDSEDLTSNIPTEEEIIQPDDFMTVSTNSLSFTMNEGSKYITINSSAEWTAISSASWCKVSPATGVAGESTLTITAENNTVESERTAIVTVTMGDLSEEITIKQAAYAEQPAYAAPTITSATEGIVLNQASPVNSSTKVAVNLQAEAGIDKLEVQIISEVLTEDELMSMGLPPKFDLASPGDLESLLGKEGFGFPVGADVKNNKDVINFDVTSFMGLLCKLGPATHTFRLTVTDNVGQVTTADLILKVEEE